MNRLAINAVGDELETCAQYCRETRIGLEVTAFAFPGILDADVPVQIERHRRAVHGISTVLSHGPFLDLVATSPDPKVVEISHLRHEIALAASGEIGASYYVAHTNYMPLIRNPAYRGNWMQKMLEFWLPLADEAANRGIVICLENMWEPVPDIQKELIIAGNHPNLRASFDNGHALVYSQVPASAWVEALGDTLAHCHLHDNSGELDEHKPIGEGKEDWTRLFNAIVKYSPEAILVAESDHFAKNMVSLAKMKDL